jgi:hypothetical protein
MVVPKFRLVVVMALRLLSDPRALLDQVGVRQVQAAPLRLVLHPVGHWPRFM